ncbi:MAG: CPBP family intramembrane metalloprotease [Myxococcales bacterium]|nr:CPBP family intramembrane metalloprotease [Myxococcales bacterium]
MEPSQEPDPQDPSGGPVEPPEPVARLVRPALVFYGILLGLAVLWRSVWYGEPLLYASEAAARAGLDPLRDLAIGLLAAGAVIGLSHQATVHTRSGRALARGLADLLGPLGPGAIAVLALTSGVAEEAFFRGALQPRVGWVVASVVFGLVHYVPRPEFRLWTLFSVAAGFLLGFLFEATGNLVAPVVTHVVINAVNLNLLVRGVGFSDEPG